MIDMLTSTVMQWLAPFVVALLGALGAFAYGRKKKAEGRKEERRRAEEARADAAANAEVVREQSAKKPVEQKRKEVSKWER